MSLKGIEVIKFNSITKRPILVKSPYDGKEIRFYKLNHYLKTISKSNYLLILDINGLSEDKLPKCKTCNEIIKKLVNNNIINPKFKSFCSTKCSNSFAAKIRIENGTHPFKNMSSESRSLLVRNGNFTKFKKGYSNIQLLTPEQISERNKKTYNTRAVQNNLPSVNYGSLRFEYLNEILYFKSKAELRVFKRYKKFLSKYYIKEKVIAIDPIYQCDYFLKREYYHTEFPKIIEIKSGNDSNFNIGYKGMDFSESNYSKFKKSIELGYDILLINDRIHFREIHRIRNIDELNILFKDYL
jgi:hypothetical protein